MPRRRLTAAVALAAALAAAACTGDAPPAASPSASATPAVTPFVPRPAATAPPTPAPEATRVPLYPSLTTGDPAAWPDGLALYVLQGCLQCDAAPETFARAARAADGNIEVTPLYEQTSAHPYIIDAWVTPEALYVLECDGCYELPAAADRYTLFESRDDGATWASLGEHDGPSRDPARWGATGRPGHAFILTPSDEGLFEVDGTVLDVSRLAPAAGFTAVHFVAGYGRYALVWATLDADGAEMMRYLTVFEGDGAPVATYEVQPRFAPEWLDADRLVARAIYGHTGGVYPLVDVDYAAIPSVIDIDSGMLHPLLDPFEAYPNSRNTVVGVRWP